MTARILVSDVITATAEVSGVAICDLVGPSHVHRFSQPRQLAMFVARELTDQSYPQIGRAFGGRDHTTVLFAYRKVNRLWPDSVAMIAAIVRIGQIAAAMALAREARREASGRVKHECEAVAA